MMCLSLHYFALSFNFTSPSEFISNGLSLTFQVGYTPNIFVDIKFISKLVDLSFV